MPEIIDPASPFAPLASPSGPATSTEEREILATRRAYSTAQKLLAGSPIAPARKLVVGWHSSSVDPETGFCALIDLNSGLDELVGEVVRVTHSRRSVFVYVLRAATLTAPFSLSRRAYDALARLSLETIHAKVEVVD